MRNPIKSLGCFKFKTSLTDSGLSHESKTVIPIPILNLNLELTVYLD